MTDSPPSLLSRPARMTLLLTLSVLLGFAGAQQTAPPSAVPTPPLPSRPRLRLPCHRPRRPA
ncbi:hypothetical protein [Deinococcus aquaticus]|uniref:hypothetical protein n=1 Tax=Deinococcus aquaticus TaxID=328692 RepID=UPI0036239B66